MERVVMDNKDIGEKIKKLRKERHITIVDLGRLVDMSKSTISLWEKGLRRPEYEELEKLAKIFNKSISYFLESDSENTITIMGRNGTHKKFTLTDEQLKVLESLAETTYKKHE